MTEVLKRLRPDPYIVAIMAMVALAAILPARGIGKGGLDVVVHAAIAILFFIYGAKISPQAIWTGITHWRLQGLETHGKGRLRHLHPPCAPGHGHGRDEPYRFQGPHRAAFAEPLR